MDKRAQQSRNDLLILYVSCFLVVLVTVGALYSLGIIGNSETHRSLISNNKVTAAAVAVPVDEPNTKNILMGNDSIENELN